MSVVAPPPNPMVIPTLTFTVCDEDDEHLQISDSDDSESGRKDDDGRVSNFYNDFHYESPEDDDDDDDDDQKNGNNSDAITTANNANVAYSNYLNKDACAASTPPYTPPELPESLPPSLKLNLPRLLNIRKMSDQGLKQLRNQIRRMSVLPGRLGSSCTGANATDDRYAYRLSAAVHNEMNNRKMSVDSAGILKHSPPSPTEAGAGKKSLLTFSHLKLSRKSVSFCQRDNVKVFDNWDDESSDDDDGDGGDGNGNGNNAKFVPPPELKGKSLIPTFSFNCKRPNYAQIFEENVLLLESLNITEVFCLMGNIRVNMSKLRRINREQEAVTRSVTVRQRASVFAVYSFDDWETWKETKAMVVKAQPHPALKAFETHAMRFYIDCDDMEVGDEVQFAIVCSDRRQTVKQGTKVTKKLRTGIGNNDKLTTVIRKYRDDNEGQFYRAKCTRQLNTWAEKAARELKNVTPIIKYKKY